MSKYMAIELLHLVKQLIDEHEVVADGLLIYSAEVGLEHLGTRSSHHAAAGVTEKHSAKSRCAGTATVVGTRTQPHPSPLDCGVPMWAIGDPKSPSHRLKPCPRPPQRRLTSMRLWRYLRIKNTLVLSRVMATRMSFPCRMWMKEALSKFLSSQGAQ